MWWHWNETVCDGEINGTLKTTVNVTHTAKCQHDSDIKGLQNKWFFTSSADSGNIFSKS